MIRNSQPYVQNTVLNSRGVLAKQAVQRVEVAEGAIHRRGEEKRIDVVDQSPANGTREVVRNERKLTHIRGPNHLLQTAVVDHVVAAGYRVVPATLHCRRREVLQDVVRVRQCMTLLKDLKHRCV